jgi:hypothetical protein
MNDILVRQLWQPARTQADSTADRDRRRGNRYDLRALVSFLWNGVQRIHHQGAGFMRDVSVCGVFVITSEPPPIGTIVRLEMRFELSLTDLPIAIQGDGRVCRVERTDENDKYWGFAASTKSLKLQAHQRQRLRLITEI